MIDVPQLRYPKGLVIFPQTYSQRKKHIVVFAFQAADNILNHDIY
jgi:hypothetical protein